MLPGFYKRAVKENTFWNDISTLWRAVSGALPSFTPSTLRDTRVILSVELILHFCLCTEDDLRHSRCGAVFFFTYIRLNLSLFTECGWLSLSLLWFLCKYQGDNVTYPRELEWSWNQITYLWTLPKYFRQYVNPSKWLLCFSYCSNYDFIVTLKFFLQIPKGRVFLIIIFQNHTFNINS